MRANRQKTGVRVLIWGILLAVAAVHPGSARAEDPQKMLEFRSADGLIELHFDPVLLEQHGLRGAGPAGRVVRLDVTEPETLSLFMQDDALRLAGEIRATGPERILVQKDDTPKENAANTGAAARRKTSGAPRTSLDWVVIAAAGGYEIRLADAGVTGLKIDELKVGLQQPWSTLRADGTLRLDPPDGSDGPAVGRAVVILRMQAAQAAGFDAAGQLETVELLADPVRQTLGGNNGTVCDQPVGPDVIVGDLIDISNYASSSGFEAYAVGTTSCNIGDQNLLWIANSDQHPVIGQNLYRLKNDRFEQIGQSWLKHGFTALTQNICGCGCSGQGGSVLGVGCSDPYCCGLNGNQTGLGPKFEVNAFTGAYDWPFSFDDVSAGGGNPDGGLYKRLQVRISDLDPAQDGGGQYFVEGHYIAPDDATAGNGENNASYREVTVGGGGTSWTLSFAAPTQREQPAIRAWQDNDATVTETDIQVPNEGLLILAAKALDVGGGFFRYEYAVQNLNSDRSVGSFSIPVASDAIVQNTGFHDVDYHSGDPDDSFDPTPYVLTDWPVTVSAAAVTWSTAAFATNPNANALRWGTVYNFSFETNAAPVSAIATLGLFKPGTPTSVTGSTVGPATGPQDCNNNGVEDSMDIADGTSQDCNGNGIPDDCETFPPCNLTTVAVAGGLTQPVLVTAPAGDPRLFIVEQTGRIKILSGGSVLGTPYLNLSGSISTGGERGLLGLAFDPDYAANGHFYVHYTNTSGDSVLARYTVSANPDLADGGSAVILKTIGQDSANHNGGMLAFGPDGMLYAALGDGGGADDPFERSQDDGSLLGKMLRLDVDAPPNYIPGDNPFVGGGDPLDEIWAKGLRNPWRFSFDRLTGDMYIGDVGQGTREEIDFQPASSTGGENYGWDCREGFVCAPGQPGDVGCSCAGSYDDPILDVVYGSDGTCSITGGYVYRGCDIPHLSGTYFFADWCGNYIRTFTYADGDPVPPTVTDRTSELQPAVGSISGVVSFGEDSAGELYIVSYGGTIYQVVCDDGSGVCGDGMLDAGEECDDNNTTPGDGCDENCMVEAGSDPNLCGGASPVGDGVTAYSTVGASTDGVAHGGCEFDGQTYEDIWFNYDATCSGTLTVSLCGSGYDTDLVVYDVCSCPVGDAELLGCNDDGCPGSAPDSYRSTLDVPVTGGNCYAIRVGGWNAGDEGTGTLTISCSGTPVSECGNDVVDAGEDCDPPNGTTCDCNCQSIAPSSVVFEDHFECDLGWQTSSEALTGGAWERGDPAGDGTRGDPTDDSDGGGQCYLTQNAAGDTDVDGGPALLTSPPLDLSCGDVSLAYAYWFTRDDAEGDDRLDVEVSVNGSNWFVVATHDVGVEQWLTNNVFINAFLKPGPATQIRFSVRDNPNNSVVEAAVDEVQISIAPFADCNANCIADDNDIANCSGDPLCGDCNGNTIPDGCEIADGSEADCDGGPVGIIAEGDALLNTFCFGCHNTDGTGGAGFPGPNIRGKSRVELWDMLDNPASGHPGGQFPNFTDADFANLEAFLSDTGSRGRPDRIPDSCQTLADCDSDSVSDACELEAETQADADYDGIPDDCQDCTDPCDDGNPCTINDTCNGLVCEGTAVDCSGAGDACNAAFCDPKGADGNCDGSTPLEDGTACDDADPCTLNDACASGSCTGGAPPDCSGNDTACSAASCDAGGAEGNCDISTPLRDGTACEDGDPCTEDDACDSGACVSGAAPDCSGAGDACNTASCDGGGAPGNCDQLTPVANGTVCSDGDPCTAGDACDAGSCQSGSAVDCSGAGDECNDAACDAGGTDGNCDLLTPTNEGGACNGGAGICVDGTCDSACASTADCADLDANNIRDDNCVWWTCDGGCVSTAIGFADMGGANGACPPDGTTDGNDRFHALNCFANQSTTGVLGEQYPCETDPPGAMNVDAGGEFGSCFADGVCDGNDAFHALNTFDGTNTCSCPTGGPAPTGPAAPLDIGHIGVQLAGPAQVRPQERIAVTVSLADAVSDLRGYQLHLAARGGRQGQLELTDIHIEPRQDMAYEADWAAFNIDSAQMVAGLNGPGQSTTAGAYLATFVYRVPADAAGVFTIELLHDDANSTERTFLFGTAPGDRVVIDSAAAVSVEVIAEDDRRLRRRAGRD